MGRRRINIGPCSEGGCERPARHRGLCGAHYQRQLRGLSDGEVGWWSGSLRRIDRAGQWEAWFDRKYGVGMSAQLLSMLKTNCVRYAEIGEKFGVTRERVRQWRNLIAKWYGLPTERGVRPRLCSIERAASRQPPELLDRILRALRSRGLDAKPYIYRGSGGRGWRANARQVSVNGRLCHVLQASVVSRLGGLRTTGYYHFRFRRHFASREFILCFGWDVPLKTAEAYVLPTAVLAQVYRDKQSFYIPVSYENYGYNNHYSRIHWQDYREAWHLISGDEERAEYGSIESHV